MANNSSNRSPSPMSSRPSLNSKTRNHTGREATGIRKSFAVTPLTKSSVIPHSQHRSFISNTPVNSPAESGRRNSFGNGSGLLGQDYEQKENERDPNSRQSRMLSPSVSKSTKNFMSPTISAASKTLPSPRKKVLTERNESVRTSASLSDGKFHFFSVNSLDQAVRDSELKSESNNSMLWESQQQLSLKESSTVRGVNFEEKVDQVSAEVPKKPKKVVRFTPDKFEIEPDPYLVVMSPEIPMQPPKPSEPPSLPRTPNAVASNHDLPGKVSYASPSALAPLDADPSFPPYDPTNNYLSPRPQFLHYRPKTRDEHFHETVNPLEESLSSDDLSENGSSEKTQDGVMQKEYEDTSSADSENDFVPKPPLSKPVVATTEINMPQDDAESKVVATAPFLTTTKAIALLLVLSVVCFPLTAVYSPMISSAISRLLTTTLEIHQYRLQYCNFTAINEVEENLVQKAHQHPFPGMLEAEVAFEEHNDQQILLPLEVDEQIEEHSEGNLDVLSETESMSKYTEDPIQDDSTGRAALDLDQFELAEEVKVVGGVEQFELVDARFPKDTDLRLEDVVNKAEANTEIQEQSDPNSQSPEGQIDMFTGELSDETVRTSDNTKSSEVEAEIPDEGQQFSRVNTSAHDFLSRWMVEVGVATVSVLAVITLIVRLSKYFFVGATGKLTSSKLVSSGITAKTDPSARHRSFSSGPVEYDMSGDSCPSELSSFQRCSSYYSDSRKGKTSTGVNEAESREKKQKRNFKRESLASSDFSMGSPSYGSFTSYSIVHSKQGDEEVVTPIRRSNRLRNQVTNS